MLQLLNPLFPRSARWHVASSSHGMMTGAAWMVALLAVLCSGCAMSSLQSPSQRRPYDRESASLHPEFTVHRRLEAMEIDVYLSVPRSELLYSRSDASSPFVAQIRVSLADTTWTIKDTAWSDSPRLLRAQWTLTQIPTRPDIELTLEDELRNASASTRQWIGPNGTWTHSDILMWSQSEDWPLFGEQASVGDTVLIQLPDPTFAPIESPFTWELTNISPPSQLPPPPYSNSRPRWDTLGAKSLGAYQADSLLFLFVPEGTTVIKLRDTPLSLRIHARPPTFPSLVEATDLISPLRYIASRSEFQRLRDAEHPKLALDDFWLACGDNPDAARGLLSTYYARVEEANESFSGLVDGWRTDRGMVHIIFGVPQRIRRDSRNEYWIYGEEGTANALTFQFRKRSYSFDSNAYELQRSIQFRSVWDRGVSNWRNGRVRGD